MAEGRESCPFCRSDANRVVDLGEDHKPHVHCDGCGADGPPADNWDLAIKKWDHRPTRKGDGDGGPR